MIFDNRLARRAKKIGLVSAMALSMAWSAYAEDKPLQFDQKSMPLNQALVQFSIQSEWQFLTSQDLLKGKTAKALSGLMSREEALKRLLEGTGLDYSVDEEGRVNIGPAGKKGLRSTSPNGRTQQLVDASDSKASNKAEILSVDGATIDEARQDGTRDAEDRRVGFGKFTEKELEEITVTGSHIRGARSASPVFIFDRTDIEQTGLTTLPQFLRTLPQNFGGGASENNSSVLSNSNGATRNFGNGSGVNLRGQGTESTLVLLDGRRMAAAGRGDFVDTSLIPLAAIERVEILTDGASAIYGSDAVGGVVNFVLRKDYQGMETRLRYGSVTEGDTEEYQVGQVFGTTWNKGHALLSYEYYHRDELQASDRSFTETGPDPSSLLPTQDRQSFFLTAGQNLSDNIYFFGNAFYSERNSENFVSNTRRPTVNFTTSEIKQFGGSVGATYEFAENFGAEIAGTYNKSETFRLRERLPVPLNDGDVPLAVRDDFPDGDTLSFDAKLYGIALDVSGGEVKVAVGGQFRRETFQNISGGEFTAEADRSVHAVFAEVNIPLISDQNRRAGFESLELTFAGRYENYSDFGSSTDPKIGLIWSPVKDISLRGTYSTSFRAPLLENLSEFNVGGTLFFLPDPTSSTGVTLAAVANGNNADLLPETATNWTLGLDYQPAFIPGFDFGFTYFNINYENRIRNNQTVFFDAFTNPAFAALITRNPDPEFIEFLFDQPFSFNGTDRDPSETEALVDGRLRNFANEKTEGMDINVSYSVNSDDGDWNFSLNSTYLFKQIRQILPSSPAIDVVDSVSNPPDFRFRGGISWALNGFSTNLFINLTGGYDDTRQDPIADVDSWSTVDFHLSYNTEDRYSNSWLHNTVFSLSVQNLFDEDPPFVLPVFDNNGINFDADNATALGRFISFGITKRW